MPSASPAQRLLVVCATECTYPSNLFRQVAEHVQRLDLGVGQGLAQGLVLLLLAVALAPAVGLGLGLLPQLGDVVALWHWCGLLHDVTSASILGLRCLGVCWCSASATHTGAAIVA